MEYCRTDGSLCRNYCHEREQATVLAPDFAHSAQRSHGQAVVTTQLRGSRQIRAVPRRDTPSPDSPAGACPTSAARPDGRCPRSRRCERRSYWRVRGADARRTAAACPSTRRGSPAQSASSPTSLMRSCDGITSSSHAITPTARRSSPLARCMVPMEAWPPARAAGSSRQSGTGGPGPLAADLPLGGLARLPASARSSRSACPRSRVSSTSPYNDP